MLKLQEFCSSLSSRDYPQITNLNLSDEEWEAVKKVVSILEHFAIQTKVLQGVQISLSDFYGGWARIKMNLSSFDDDLFARNLLSQMKKREKDLFDNSLLNASVYLDPRFQKYMPHENKENAISFLKHLYSRIIRIEGGQVSQLEQQDDDLASFLNKTILGQDSNSNSNGINENQNSSLCDTIDTMLRNHNAQEPINTSVFNYWEQNKTLKPELYKLACAVHSVPPTQTTVERAFSAMAIVFSALRTNLSDQNLENILLLRLNKTV